MVKNDNRAKNMRSRRAPTRGRDLRKLIDSPMTGAKDSYYGKLVYNREVERIVGRASHVVDFTKGEKCFYGRMDIHQIPIVLTNTRRLARIRHTSESTRSFSALAFVVDVFNMMVNKMKEGAQMNKIIDDDYLSDLKVYRAFESPTRAYDRYRDIYYSRLKKELSNAAAEDTFKDVNEFMRFMPTFLKGKISQAPLTLPSYVKSKFCNIMSSGLAIEIADLDYLNDKDKIDKFYKNPNWNYFMQVCNAHGFMIDKNCPWRIVADVNSEVMVRSAKKRGMPSGYGFFDNYQTAASVYVGALGTELHSLYHMLLRPTYNMKVTCSSGVERTAVKATQKYSLKQMYRQFTPEDFLIFYMSIRIEEQRPDMEEFERKMLIENCIKLYQADKNAGLAIKIFESVVSSTLDKLGTFEYYKRQALLHQQYLFDMGLINNMIVELFDTPTFTSGGGY